MEELSPQQRQALEREKVWIENTAKVCHEVNRAYCEAIGDMSQAPWDLAPDWQKESARGGVRLLLSNPNTKPEDSHKSWMETKIADGWTYGPEKDSEKKTHPCLVPYEELPAAQKAKDHIFIAAHNMILFIKGGP